jgi:hypothetical protein
MKTQTTFCTVCKRDVAITWTPAPVHQGHACIPDGPELVCLDVTQNCETEVCPLSNMARVVMAARLTRARDAADADASADKVPETT